jgi:hypothetical protein
VISNGLQLHLKNLLEASVKVSRCRTNKASFNSYDGLAKMVVDHGKGYPLSENQSNIAMKWAPDAHAALLTEEAEARKLVSAANLAEEEALVADMTVYDEERMRMSSSAAKRKMQDADIPWWQKDVRTHITLSVNCLKSCILGRCGEGRFVGLERTAASALQDEGGAEAQAGVSRAQGDAATHEAATQHRETDHWPRFLCNCN